MHPANAIGHHDGQGPRPASGRPDRGPADHAPLDDPSRLAALARTGLMDGTAEPSFDRLARLAARFLGVPIALVSLVDADRQFFKSCVGLAEPWAGARGTPLSHSFCQHVVTSGRPLVIDDARSDPLLAGNLAIEEIGVVAYLGIPLTVDGRVIGSFCAIDGEPRGWTPDDVAVMGDLAESVVTEIRLRGELAEVARQRAAAEEARRHVEVTLASIGDAVISTDERGSITFLNPVAEALCGWADAEARGLPLGSVFRIVDGRTRRPVEDPVSKVLATGQVVELAYHTVLIARDGGETPIDDSAAPIVDAAGEVVGVVLIFRDVADRERDEKELLEAKLRLDHALSAGSVATFTWDIARDRFVGDANMASFYSIPPEEVDGGPVGTYFDAIHPDDRDRVALSLGEAVRIAEPFEEEYRIVRPDGPVRWVVGRGRVDPDEQGRPSIMSGVILDVTDRKRGEELIRRGEERYRALFDSMDEGFCVLKLAFDADDRPIDYRFLEVNPAFERLTQLQQSAGRWVSELLPGVTHEWHERYGRVARTGVDDRFEMTEPSLEGRCFGVYAFRIGAAADRKVAVLFNDISDRKRAEKDREDLVEQLTDADRRKDEFLAMLAHELRNPLAAISGALQLVRQAREPELLGQLREMIQGQVEHLAHLIDDLLDVSRITQGKIELRKATVELAGIVRRATDLARQSIAEKHHKLTVKLPPGPVRFVADPTRVEQVLNNLLTNAAKYSDPARAIVLWARVEGEEVVFRVIDEGFGISAEMLPRVFGLFTQVDATIDRSRGGLGIGLTLVKSLVEMHGGTVEAKSEGEGRGAEFVVRLPIGRPDADAVADAGAASTAPAVPTAGSGRVLVVDDNVQTARMTARMLGNAGFTVQAAHDGLEGLALARQFRPAIVLLDIGLPGMNGYDVARAVRQEPWGPGATLIAVSGYGEDKARDRSKAAGFDHHLLKPLDFDQLMALIGTGARPGLP